MVLFRAPNTFLQFWTAKELRGWWHELKCRERSGVKAYEYLNVPTRKQVLAEFRRRKLTVKPRRRDAWRLSS